MSIQVFSIRLGRFYFILIALVPLWIVIPVLLQLYGGYQAIAVIAGLALLTITAIIAQKISRKQIGLNIENNTVSFDDTSILTQDILNIKINKSGIGMSAIEFNLKSGKKIVLNLPNYKGNADLAIAFIEKNLPEIEQIKPVDLLG